MTSRFVSKINQNLVLVILFFFISLLIGSFIITNSYYKNKQQEFYSITSEELARKISYDVKISNVFNIQTAVSDSYLSRAADFLEVKDATGLTIFSYPHSDLNCKGEAQKTPVMYDEKNVGTLVACLSPGIFQSGPALFIIPAILSIIVFLMIKIWFSLNTSGLLKLMQELDHLKLEDIAGGKQISVTDKSLEPVIYKLNDLLMKLKEIYHYEEHDKIAKQIRHDIRSPLLVLSTIVGDSQELPANQKQILVTAVERISKILSDLNKAPLEAPVIKHEEAVFLEFTLVNILSDKRIEYQGREIDFSITTENRQLSYVKTNEAEFYRAFSNLINNAVEALNAGKGFVRIHLTEKASAAVIEITDNGKGIPKDIQNKIFDSGFTTKSTGSGLGLVQVKKYLESIGGKISVDSNSSGTKIRIELPVLQHASLIQELNLKYNSICVVDDDISIHNLWKSRIGNTLETEFATEPARIPFIRTDCTWIIDQDFGPDKMKGMDFVVQTFSDKDQVYLCTNNFTDYSFLASCLENQIKVIPKFLVPSLPIKILK